MSQGNKHIIVPVDFSDQAKIALSQTFNLARKTNSEITLLHVIDEALFSSVLHLFSSIDQHEELLRTGIQTKLNELAKETEAKSGVRVHTRIEKGKIYDVVSEVAGEMNASFIVMGTSGETTLKKKFIGSNAVRVIGDAPCPVITIKGKEHKSGCETIVLPLDLSKETKEKVSKCIEIAKLFGSTVKVMSVIASEDEFLINKLERQMEQVTSFISGHGITCSGEFVHHKSVSDSVIDYSRKVNADLIVIMTQKELEWSEFLIGTDSQQIINESEIPVCSIRPMQRKDTTEFVIT